MKNQSLAINWLKNSKFVTKSNEVRSNHIFRVHLMVSVYIHSVEFIIFIAQRFLFSLYARTFVYPHSVSFRIAFICETTTMYRTLTELESFEVEFTSFALPTPHQAKLSFISIFFPFVRFVSLLHPASVYIRTCHSCVCAHSPHVEQPSSLSGRNALIRRQGLDWTFEPIIELLG